LWGTKVSAGTVSQLNKKVYGQIETWRKRPLQGDILMSMSSHWYYINGFASCLIH